LIEAAHSGSREVLGHLLESCRQYLLLIANEELGDDLQAKAGASDLVQETFLEAQRDFEQFKGGSEVELRGWLRRILLHNVTNFTRSFRATGMRELGREVSFSELGNNPLVSRQVPDADLIARERDQALADAIQRLPEHYRQVIVWRNYDRLSFAEIGTRTQRSEEAARKLWVRAIENLQELLEGTG
jgi:RNA polymerase sigma-70 factor (ECF subfamily)